MTSKGFSKNVIIITWFSFNSDFSWVLIWVWFELAPSISWSEQMEGGIEEISNFRFKIEIFWEKEGKDFYLRIWVAFLVWVKNKPCKYKKFWKYYKFPW